METFHARTVPCRTDDGLCSFGCVSFQLEKKVLTIDLMELAALLNQTAGGHHQVSVKLKNGALFLEVRKRLNTISRLF